MSKHKQTVWLAGMGMGTSGSCLNGTVRQLEECDCIIGAARLLEELRHLNKPMYSTYKAAEIKAYIMEHQEFEQIAAVYSGDTGFYSGAMELHDKLKDICEVKILPGISSVTYFAARLGVSWADARLLSIHGRSCPYINILAKNRKTFMLFGGSGCAEEFCRSIKLYELNHIKIWIGRSLSYETESIVCRTGAELLADDLQGLVILYLENDHPQPAAGGNLPDAAFIRGNVPMTKEEIRFISIAKLGLKEDSVLYDIGAGTGSISIEAAMRLEGIRVYAVEKKSEALELIRRNQKKFYADQITVIDGMAPDVLDGLEMPTHVFIGGSSGNLKEILVKVKGLNPQVKVVINAITLETLTEALAAEQEGLLGTLEIVQAGITKTRSIAGYHMLDGQNPVYIITEHISAHMPEHNPEHIPEQSPAEE